ncbi:Dual 3'5'-cyclic-AMP and GMP phosphodiesterase 11 [Taenia crassiceps]|uniref:Dual 3'5'-cyclic-AMP and GMP phosphodiesterase 11 n=1 Tax=Taenia crassiceps TaxID=6207 RepID=A0ABR4Q155_9CEST
MLKHLIWIGLCVQGGHEAVVGAAFSRGIRPLVRPSGGYRTSFSGPKTSSGLSSSRKLLLAAGGAASVYAGFKLASIRDISRYTICEGRRVEVDSSGVAREYMYTVCPSHLRYCCRSAAYDGETCCVGPSKRTHTDTGGQTAMVRRRVSRVEAQVCIRTHTHTPWSAELVANEFFEQGDFERQKLNIKPDAVVDRELSHQFPQMQIEFIDAICAPVYELISRVCVRLRPLLEGCLANRDCWSSVAKGEAVKEASMRLPSDAEGADTSYRDRLMALLNAPSSSTAVHLEGTPTSLAVPNSDAANTADFPASSAKTARCTEDNDATSSTTVGGGGAAP